MKHWGSERHREYLDRAVTVGNKRSVAMPYVGWVTLADLLKQEAFTKWGKGRPSKLVGDAKGTRSALHCIGQHTVAAASHPALQGYSVMGCSEQLFTAWPVGAMMLRDQWSLGPTWIGPMVVLWPEYTKGVQATSDSAAFKVDLTTWHPIPWDDAYRPIGLFPEPEHLGWL